MMKKAILLVVLMVGVLVGGCAKGAKAPTPAQKPPAQPPANTGPSATSIPIPPTTSCPLVDLNEEGSGDLGGAILFVLDSSYSGSDRANGMENPNFRYLFPRFFAKVLYEMAKSGDGFDYLRNYYFALAIMGNNEQNINNLKVIVPFTQVQKWLTEENENKNSSPSKTERTDGKMEKFLEEMQNSLDKDEWGPYRHIDYDALITSAIRGIDPPEGKGWPHNSQDSQGKLVGRKLVVVLTDGDIPAHFDTWQNELGKESMKDQLDVIFVVLPSKHLLNTTNPNKIYAFAGEHNSHFHILHLKGDEDKWAEDTWNAIANILFDDQERKRVKWLPLSKSITFTLPEKVVNGGRVELNVVGWNCENGVLEKPLELRRKFLPRGKGKEVSVNEIEGGKIMVYGPSNNVGVVWINYKVPRAFFYNASVQSKVINNEPLTIHVERCVSKQKWSDVLLIQAESDRGEKVFGEAKPSEFCHKEDLSCDYVWEHPTFVAQGEYSIVVAVDINNEFNDECSETLNRSGGMSGEMSEKISAGKVKVQFSPELTGIEGKKGGEVVLYFKNVGKDQLQNARLRVFDNKCANDANGNCGAIDKWIKVGDSTTCWHMEYRALKVIEPKNTIEGEITISVNNKYNFWNTCAKYAKPHLKLGEKEYVIDFSRCNGEGNFYAYLDEKKSNANNTKKDSCSCLLMGVGVKKNKAER